MSSLGNTDVFTFVWRVGHVNVVVMSVHKGQPTVRVGQNFRALWPCQSPIPGPSDAWASFLSQIFRYNAKGTHGIADANT